MSVDEQQQYVTSLAERHTPETSNTTHSLTGKRVLIVEDDEMLARFLERMLRAQGVEVTAAHTGHAALGALHSQLDLVILDLNLPGMDGISVLGQLRSKYFHLPVLVLTGRSRPESSALALDSGADDCLSKPFSCVELMARLRALLRRTAIERFGEQAAPKGSLSLNAEEFRAIRDGKAVDLTPREFRLLEYMMRSPGKVVPRTVLLKEVWGDESSAGSNVVDVYVKYVRDKIDLPGLPKLIRTVRGVGYAVGHA